MRDFAAFRSGARKLRLMAGTSERKLQNPTGLIPPTPPPIVRVIVFLAPPRAVVELMTAVHSCHT
jgi:hypothetical protein